MKWRKLGRIFCADRHSEWMHSHAMIPVATQVDNDLFRIFFSPRDSDNRGHGAYLDIDMRNPTRVEYLHDKPVLMPGELGCFDDSGALPNSLVEVNGKMYLYYTGINLGVTVKIRNSIGLAVWDESSQVFEKCFPGPVIDRTRSQPHFVATPEVHLEDGRFRAWFTSCTRWEETEGEAKHFYNIEYAESENGIDWERDAKVAIDFHDQYEYALGVPRVIKENGQYRMWFCSRATKDNESYRLRYAESTDGVSWQRKPGLAGIDVSEGNDWDSNMICYPYIFDYAGNRYLLYNGNDYGKTGFGLAIME